MQNRYTKDYFDNYYSYYDPYVQSIKEAENAFNSGNFILGIERIGNAILQFVWAPIKFVWDQLYEFVDWMLKIFTDGKIVQQPPTALDRYGSMGTSQIIPEGLGTSQGIVNQYSDWYAKNPVSPKCRCR